MSDNNSGLLCALGGWGLAICAGVLGAILLMVLGDWRLIQAIFAAIVIIVLVGGFMTWVVCRPLPEQGQIPRSTASTNPTLTNQESAQAAATQAKAGASGASGSSDASAATAKSAPSSDTTDSGQAETSAASDAESTSGSGSASASASGSADGSGVKPSTPLSGEAELSERKGSWTYNGGAAKAASASASASASATAAAAASETATDASADASAAAAKSTKDDDAAASKADAAPATNAAGEVDYDKDGKFEGTDEGTKPQGLDGPRGGTADNLKEIKGIGPKLEKLCNSMGFYHFDQIAGWSADEVAWVNANLVGFKGRVSRDNWIEQAKVLAAGGETEFSKRVEDGDVY